MKVLLPIVLIILIPLFGFSQTVQSSCNLNDTIASIYKKDAERLAIRRAFHVNSSWKDSINYNRIWSNNYLKALIAVHNATALPARDTVIRRIKIHTLRDPNTASFYISADSNLLWMKNIRNNISPTGNAILDNAVSKYYLQKISFSAWNNVPYHDAVYKTDTSINILPLATKIYAMPGVVTVAPNGYAIDGNDIFDSLNVNFTMLTYTYGWNDCYLGCINRRYWHFKVYSDCSVEYTGSHGDAVPLNVGLKQEINDFSDLNIYPNPTKDKLTIQFGMNFSNATGVLNNVLGQTIYDFYTVTAIHEIDLSFLPTGIYFLKLKNISGQKTIKIVKE